VDALNADIPRWAQRWGAPFKSNPFFPINTLTLMRGAVGMPLRQPADFKRHADAVWHTMWMQPRNLGDAAELSAVLQAAGFDPAAFLALVGDADVKAKLVAITEASATPCSSARTGSTSCARPWPRLDLDQAAPRPDA
jgi:2-hydroxychromene-2-carboxylate isomerase